MWAIEVQRGNRWEPLGEGPFPTEGDAVAYGTAEVGIVWRVVRMTVPELVEVAEEYGIPYSVESGRVCVLDREAGRWVDVTGWSRSRLVVWWCHCAPAPASVGSG